MLTPELLVLLTLLAPMPAGQALPADPLQRAAYKVAVLGQHAPDAPAWKLDLYRDVLASGQGIGGRCRRTNYCPRCSGTKCSDGSRVRRGVCAASRNIRMHSVLWLASDGIVLVTDRGGAVRVGHGLTNSRENARIDCWQQSCGASCQDGTLVAVPWALLLRGDGNSRRNSLRKPANDVERGLTR